MGRTLPTGRTLWLRTAGVTGLLLLAFFLVGIDAFLADGTTAGASSRSTAAPIAADRNLKGDRQPISVAPTFVPDWDYVFGAVSNPQPVPRPRAQVPVGCDPAFSPIFSSRLSPNVYRRCTV